MRKEKKNQIDKTMEEVIETSKKMRDLLLNENVSLEERQKNLKVFNAALTANKNIVSAASIQVNIEKFGD